MNGSVELHAFFLVQLLPEKGGGEGGDTERLEKNYYEH